MEKEIELMQALDYEIRASLIASYISNDTLQNWISKYYVWKVKRKYNRYRSSKYFERRVKESRIQL